MSKIEYISSQYIMYLFLFNLLNLFSILNSSQLQGILSKSLTLHSCVWKRYSFLWLLQFNLISHLFSLVSPLTHVLCVIPVSLCIQKIPWHGGSALRYVHGGCAVPLWESLCSSGESGHSKSTLCQHPGSQPPQNVPMTLTIVSWALP